MNEYEANKIAQEIISDLRREAALSSHGAWILLNRVTQRLHERAGEIINQIMADKPYPHESEEY